ncbi:MAG: hypothetical protein AMJ91_00460 [candidate division Zixibacteria bacterium SM23_73_3]|nr:MAG: hypothetical protein AMJ91_00460 [candidate division Zixibacteria bacterium SM23_73_3]
MTLSHLDKGLARNNEHLFKKERRFLIRLLTGQPKTCYENLSLDEIISRCCARLSLVTLRFWRVNGASVVVGYGNECAKTVDIVACKNSRVRIIRRFSGGGSVFLSEKCLNYTIIIPQTLSNGLRHISPSFQAINGMVVDTLKEFQLPAKVEEDTDVAVNSRKIAGSSQSRRWGVLCHQGTILIESETENIEKLIKNPTKQPKYRNGRTHKDFLTSLKQEREEIDDKLFERRLKSRMSLFLKQRLRLPIIETQVLTEEERNLNKATQLITHII